MIVVGGGISAVGLLDEISQGHVTKLVHPPGAGLAGRGFDRQAGHDAVALVEERVRQGLPPQSVVAVTGLIWTPALRAAAARGVLERQPDVHRDRTRRRPAGRRRASWPADVILWATGFRAELEHLAPLHLRGPGGGIAMDGTRVAAEPRVHLVGYGPSSSTIGANRAGRAAVTGIVKTAGRIVEGDHPRQFAQPESGPATQPGQKAASDTWRTTALRPSSARLRRYPDVEAANLQAWDATDKLLLDSRRPACCGPAARLAVVGDRYGALTLGRWPSGVRSGAGPSGAGAPGPHHRRAGTAEQRRRPWASRRLRTAPARRGRCWPAPTWCCCSCPGRWPNSRKSPTPWPGTRAPGVVLLAGGRVKHMSLGMNAVLERYFGTVQPQLARQKSRLLLASGPMPVSGSRRPSRSTETTPNWASTVCARGAVFAGTGLDIGTRFLLDFLPRMPHARQRRRPGLRHRNPGGDVRAQPTPAPGSRPPTGRPPPSTPPSPPPGPTAWTGRIDVLQDDAMSSLPDGSADLVLLNPPFHLGAAVHAGAGIKMIEAAGRVLAPGGELWTVFNSHLHYLPALERLIGPTREVGRNPKFTVTASTTAGTSRRSVESARRGWAHAGA